MVMPSWRLDLDDMQIPSEEQPEDHPGKKRASYWWSYGTGGSTEEGKDAVRVLRNKIVNELGRDLENVCKSNADARSAYEASNISIRRAFHDDLGVRNIMFIFSDDLLSSVYRAPWYVNASLGWKKVLDKVFLNTIGVHPSCVIRCLLAALPPGAVIPPHHDTGLWSMRSHRVHIPIFTSSQDGEEASEVVFKVGPHLDSMMRVPFVQGSVIELNNRAKHCVNNNWSQYRIHLIMDYVEKDTAKTLNFVPLAPGQIVRQARRRIYIGEGRSCNTNASDAHLLRGENFSETREKRTKELLSMVEKGSKRKNLVALCARYTHGEMLGADFLTEIQKLLKAKGVIRAVEKLGLLSLIANTDTERASSLLRLYESFARSHCISRAPRYVIIGVMKCGTTSLYEYINEHPRFVRARLKETHFFDWKWDAVQKLSPLSGKALEAATMLLGTDASSQKRVDYMRAFQVDELLKDEQLFTGEATPSYILGGKKVARRLKEAAGDGVRIIVTLRDPVKRAYSHYNMTADPTGTELQKARRGHVAGKCFEQLLDEDFDLLRACGIYEDGKTDVDEDIFESSYLAKLPQNHGGHAYVGRGIYWLQLKLWMDVFPKWREQFHFVLLEKLSADPEGEMRKLWKFLGVEVPAISCPATKSHNTRSYRNPMDDAIKERLRAFYAPHNQQLSDLLGIDIDAWM